MAINDETIRLILDMGQSGKTADEVRRKLDELGASARKTADSYEVLTRQVGTYEIATDRVNAELEEEVSRAAAATAAQRALGRALDETAAVAERAAASALKPGRAMLESGRVIQDFAQGGIAGILNNIEGLTSSLGLGAGLAGALTTVGVAAYIAGPKLKEMWDALTAMPKEKVPETTDRIEGMTKAIKANKDAMEELTKQGKVYAYELDILKERAFKLTQQEKELADAQLARSVGPFAGKAAQERAGAFRAAVAEYGGGDKLLEALRRAGIAPGQAEAGIAGALRGERGMAELVVQHLGALGARDQLQYFSPERQRRAIRQREQTEAALDRNAERMREAGKALSEIGPGEAEAERTAVAREAAARHAPVEAARAERARERAALEARQRAAAAQVERAEGVRMPPAEALQHLEGQRRRAQQEQLDRNRELRTAEAIARETNEPYDPGASIEALRRRNAELMAALERFADATNQNAAGAAAMARILNARAGFLEGQGQMNGAPGVSGGKP